MLDPVGREGFPVRLEHSPGNRMLFPIERERERGDLKRRPDGHGSGPIDRMRQMARLAKLASTATMAQTEGSRRSARRTNETGHHAALTASLCHRCGPPSHNQSTKADTRVGARCGYIE